MWPFPKHSKRSTQPPMPGWMKILLGVFFLYIALKGLAPDTPEAPNVVRKAIEETSKQVDLSAYKNKLFPNQRATLQIQDIETPAGKPAICGQTVSIAYTTHISAEETLKPHATKDKPLRFKIGEGKTMPVFEQSALGMTLGSTRSVIAPPQLSYGIEEYHTEDVPNNVHVRFEIEMLEATPPYPDIDTAAFRIIDITPGNGPTIGCAKTITLRATAWNARGTLLFENKPIKVTPGENKAMLGLEQGIIGMYHGGVRMLVIPPSFQKTLGGDSANSDLRLPSGEFILVEVTALP